MAFMASTASSCFMTPSCLVLAYTVSTMPSLGMLTVNALAAADSVIVPVQAQYLPAKGLEQLLTAHAPFVSRTPYTPKCSYKPIWRVCDFSLTLVQGEHFSLAVALTTAENEWQNAVCFSFFF